MGIKGLLPTVAIAVTALGLNGCANWNADEWGIVAAAVPLVVDAIGSSDSPSDSSSYASPASGTGSSYSSSAVSGCTMAEYRRYETSLTAVLAQVEAQKGKNTGICAPTRQAKSELTRFAAYLERCPEFDIDRSARNASYAAIPTYTQILSQACNR